MVISFLSRFISEPDKVFEPLKLEPQLLQTLTENIQRRLTPKAVKIRSDIEVKCFSYEGIDAIKAALRAGEAVSTEAIPIKIRLVAPPLYVVTTNSTDKTGGVERMEAALAKIEEKITELGGEMSVKMKVRRAPSLPFRSQTLSRLINLTDFILPPAESRLGGRGPRARGPHGQGRARECRGLGR